MMDASDLNDFIASNGIDAEIVTLVAETPTVEAAAEAVGVSPDQICKSLLFLVQGEPLLVITNGTTRVSYKSLAQHLEISRKKLKMATADQVQHLTGYAVGTVPPFGHRQPVTTLLEDRVLTQKELYAGGGAINALMRITSGELQRVIVTQGLRINLPETSPLRSRLSAVTASLNG